jgi:bifunctional UDP-N-acetylglucosamine pyrophosphorylase / glucosamine-1-phosphate N-acetyltransferase
VGRSAIVLAAGLGTRMKSKHHKVLHKVCGKPMILHILDELEKMKLDQVIVVLGQQRETVAAVMGDRAQIAVQEQQLGTGHAVQAAIPYLSPTTDTTVVLYGDAPLIRAETIEKLFEARAAHNAAACVLTAEVENPTGLGRVFVTDDGSVQRIVEEKDATVTEKANHLINTGIYAFRTADMIRSLSEIQPNNAQGEYYLTDTLTVLRSTNQSVLSFCIEDADEIASVNDLVQLADVERILRDRICRHWAMQGVTILDPTHTYIGTEVRLGPDTVLLPGCTLEGATVIGEDCVIGPHTRLQNVVVGDRVKVEQSVALDSSIQDDSTVGPFAYLRPGSRIGSRVKIGDFVEIKNSVIDDDSKVSHLAYVGDALIGQRVNVGCGVITVNYDGKLKHQTVVGDDSFVGSNVNLIAPVRIGEGAYVCAGSTITEEVPGDAFAIGRAKQVTKPDYVQAWKQKRYGKGESKGE